nr:zinc finger, CCHC-type [Tanacetum cinerariifolium]
MVDSRPVMEQYNELLRILRQYTQHGLKIDESISVSSIIEKLPPSWKDFKHNLKHGKEDLSLVQLGSHLRIEESLRAHHKQNKGKKGPMRTTVVLVQTRNQSWNVGSVTRLVTSKGNAVVVKRTTQMLVVQERGLRTNPNTKVDAIAWWIDSDSVYMSSSTIANSSLWHARLGHVYYKRMLKMSKDDLIPAIDENPEKCTTYRGGEYYDPVFFQSVGIIHETTAPYTPQQNGVTERKNRALKEMVNSILSYSGLSEGFWGEAIAVVRLPDPKRKTLGEKVLIASLLDMLSIPRHIGCKWIFKRKMKVDETIDKFKARLVIQGFRQKEGIDYFDTYAPVSRITTIRLMLALEAIHNLVIHQMDVKTTFLNGDLDEEVYMKQREGFVTPGNEHKVCKLVKLLYGLKQAPKQWNQKFDEVVLSSGFHLNQSDKCVYRKFDNSEKLKPNTEKPIDQLEYSRAIGCLMYAMTSTRPDIAYAVGRLSRFTSNPSRQHWKAITRVFKYLRGTKDYGLSYVGYPSVLEGAISWASKKQTCITGSTIESEFVALAAAGEEAEWLRNLIHEIPIWPKPIAPISIRCDSALTMARAYSQIYNVKSRHLGARSKGTTYVNMKFNRFKKLGLNFLYVHQWIGTHGF